MRWPRRRVMLGAGIALALLVGAGVLVATSGDEGTTRERSVDEAVAAALARLPADAAVVSLVATDGDARQARAAHALLGRVPGAGIALESYLGDNALVLEALARLGDAPVAAAVTPGRDGLVLAWVADSAAELGDILQRLVRDGRLRRRGDLLAPKGGGPGFRAWRITALAREGPLLVAGSDAALVRAALARRPVAHPAARSLAALPRDALVRAVVRPWAVPERLRALLPDLGESAVTVEPTSEGVEVHASVPVRRVPLAIGPRAAAPAGLEAPLTVGVRQPSSVLPTALDALGASDGWDRVGSVLRRLRRDDLDAVLRDQLTGTATVGLERDRTAVQLQLRDAGPLRDLLSDVARLPDLVLGRTGVDVDDDDGVFTVRLPDAPELRVTVSGDRVGIVTAGDPRPVATRAPAARTTPGAGALAVRLEARALQERLRERFGLPPIAALALRSLGDLTLGVTASPGRLDAELVLPIGR